MLEIGSNESDTGVFQKDISVNWYQDKKLSEIHRLSILAKPVSIKYMQLLIPLIPVKLYMKKAQSSDKNIIIKIICGSFGENPHLNFIIKNDSKRLKRLKALAVNGIYYDAIKVSRALTSQEIFCQENFKKMRFLADITYIFFIISLLSLSIQMPFRLYLF